MFGRFVNHTRCNRTMGCCSSSGALSLLTEPFADSIQSETPHITARAGNLFVQAESGEVERLLYDTAVSTAGGKCLLSAIVGIGRPECCVAASSLEFALSSHGVVQVCDADIR